MYAFACVITLLKCAVRCSKFRLIGFLRFAIWGVAALPLCCVIAVYNLISQLEKEGIFYYYYYYYNYYFYLERGIYSKENIK